MSEYYTHLKEKNYLVRFPDALDDIPVFVQKRTFIDAWIFNRLFTCIKNVEQFIIDNPIKFEV